MDLERMNNSPIGYINPLFKVETALAALGDGGERAVIDMKCDTYHMLRLFSGICEAVIDVLVKDCIHENEDEIKSAVVDTVSGIVATSLADKFLKEGEENEQSV